MSFRQNIVYKILPKRAASFSKCIVEQSSRQNPISNYSKIINIDGTKNGATSNLQKNSSSPSKANTKKSAIQAKFQNKLLNFLMVAVKNQYKNSFKKKQSVKSGHRPSQSLHNHNKSSSLVDFNSRNKKTIKMEEMVNVQKKEIVEQNTSNCLKNEKLLNIKLTRVSAERDVNFIPYNKQFIKKQSSYNLERKPSSSPKAKLNDHSEHQDGYLSSQIGDFIVVSAERKNSRIKTEQLNDYLLDNHVRQYLSLEKDILNERTPSKSEGIRVFSALQMFSSQKRTGNIKRGYMEKPKVSSFNESGLHSKSVFESSCIDKRINEPFKVTNLPKKMPIYSRKKHNFKNTKANPHNNQYAYFDNFIVPTKQVQRM